MVRARHAVLRLCAELPGSAAAVDPRQADPGRSAGDRRSAGADQRTVLRAVLLPDLDPRRMARGSDQPRPRAVFCVRTVERGDGRLRILIHVPAARRGSHGGRSGRGGRRTAFVRDHLRLLSVGDARHGARAVQLRAAVGAGARCRIRCVDRCQLQLAQCIRRARRRRDRRGGHGLCAGSRAAARRSRFHADVRSGAGVRRFTRLRCDARDVLLAAGARAHSAGQRRDAVRHLRLAELHDALPHARERHDAERDRDLLRVAGRCRHQRRHVRVGPPGRPVSRRAASRRMRWCRRSG